MKQITEAEYEEYKQLLRMKELLLIILQPIDGHQREIEEFKARVRKELKL
jgi:hypothetical protein